MSDELRRSVSSARNIVVLLLVLTGVAFMHFASLDAVADHSATSRAPIAMHDGDQQVPPAPPTHDEDHHGAAVACCLLVLASLTPLISRRTSQLLFRRSPTATARYTARGAAVVLVRARPPDRPRFALSVIRT